MGQAKIGGVTVHCGRPRELLANEAGVEAIRDLLMHIEYSVYI